MHYKVLKTFSSSDPNSRGRVFTKDEVISDGVLPPSYIMMLKKYQFITTTDKPILENVDALLQDKSQPQSTEEIWHPVTEAESDGQSLVETTLNEMFTEEERMEIEDQIKAEAQAEGKTLTEDQVDEIFEQEAEALLDQIQPEEQPLPVDPDPIEEPILTPQEIEALNSIVIEEEPDSIDKFEEQIGGKTFLFLTAVFIAIVSGALTVMGYSALFPHYESTIIPMLIALELSKFSIVTVVLTHKGHIPTKPVLLVAVFLLYIIASIGHYSYLSKAYFSSALTEQVSETKSQIVNDREKEITTEIARLNKLYEDMPTTQTTKRMKFYKKIEPKLEALNTELKEVRQSKQHLTEVQSVNKEVGAMKYTSILLGVSETKIANYIIMTLSLLIDLISLMLAHTAFHIRRK